MNDVSPYVIRSTVPGQQEIPRSPVVGPPIEISESANLRDYWHVIKKHKAIIATCLFAAVVVAAVIVLMTTPIYTARTTLLIERKEPQVVDVKNVLSESSESDADDYYKTQYEILKSRSLAAQTIQEQGLEKNVVFVGSADESRILKILKQLQQLPSKAFGWINSFFREPAPVKPGSVLGVNSKLVDAYQGMLEVEPIQRTRLVKIAFNAPDPQLSAQVANAHAEAYIRQGLKLRSQANQEAQSFLEEKLKELKKRVEESEAALNVYRREKGIISLDDKENIVVERLADLNKRLTEAEAERIGLEAQVHLIRRRDYDSLPAVIASGLISSLKTQLTTLQGEYANLSAQFKAGYPQLARVKANLEEVQLRLQHEIRKIVSGVVSAHIAARGKENELRAKMEQQKAATLELKDAAVDYAVLAREVDTNRQLYDSVLGRMKEVGVAAEVRASNIYVIDKAEPPLIPSSPRKKLIFALAAVLGLMGGLGLALLFEHLDDTLKTSEDAERYLAVPNLGLVPEVRSSNRFIDHAPIIRRLAVRKSGNGNSGSAMIFYPREPEEKPVSSFHSSGVANEAYRTLRTGILLSQGKQPPKTVLFTSAVHGEGKTATVVNTAISFARMGVRVLLIDADLRRPFCHKILGMRRGLGVAELLGGEIRPSWAIQPTHVDNLFFISSGSSALDPTEYIGSMKMREILSSLRRHYDYILIDSPPVMAVSDALLLSTMADGVVVVIGGQGTPRDTVRLACSRLHYAHAKILGTMLNRVNTNGNGYAEYYEEPFHAEQRT
jgi:succinoglycan biosynthesis transport protein ExoP